MAISTCIQLSAIVANAAIAVVALCSHWNACIAIIALTRAAESQHANPVTFGRAIIFMHWEAEVICTLGTSIILQPIIEVAVVVSTPLRSFLPIIAVEIHQILAVRTVNGVAFHPPVELF